jgi:hypothetical protein
MGGAARVMDTGAVRGTSGVEGTTWGIAEVVGAARGATEVGETGDRGAVQGRALKPPRWRSDRQPLFHGRSDCLS